MKIDADTFQSHADSPESAAPPVTAANDFAAGDRSSEFPEEALVEAASQGDRDAFAAIVKQHQNCVFGFLRARLIEPADAEDLCQDVFLRSYQGRAEFRRAHSLRSWLIGIARNVLREHVRRSRRRREIAWTELCLELDVLMETTEEQRRYESNDALDHLPTCLDSLGQTARQAIDLRYRDQLKLAEIGKRTERGEGAVKLLMFRARQALKNCLDRKINRSQT